VEISKPKTEFLRYEFKYLLPNELRKAVEKELGHFMDLDPFVQAQPDRKYFVRSLYFDDPFNSAFYEKIDGMLSRKKFRLRTYSLIPTTEVPIFLEQKGRHNNLVVKVRTPLREEANCEIANQSQHISSLIMSQAEKGFVLDRFQYEYFKKNIRPVALIDYTRRPYISRLDAEFRLTFDDNLFATPAQSLWPEQLSGRKECVSGYTIMEVKFRYHMPAWFHAVVQSFNLVRVSISKIVCGMKTLDLAKDLS
jgi:hypothetical protein